MRLFNPEHISLLYGRDQRPTRMVVVWQGGRKCENRKIFPFLKATHGASTLSSVCSKPLNYSRKMLRRFINDRIAAN
jgi:hypothetical protein